MSAAATSATREDSVGEPTVIRQAVAFRAQWDKAEAGLRPVEHRVQYSNFKVVDGLNLAHTWTRSVDGKLRDITTFEAIRINQAIEDSRFTVSR